MGYKKVTRDQIATYLNTTPSTEKETWSIVGVLQIMVNHLIHK